MVLSSTSWEYHHWLIYHWLRFEGNFKYMMYIFVWLPY